MRKPATRSLATAGHPGHHGVPVVLTVVQLDSSLVVEHVKLIIVQESQLNKNPVLNHVQLGQIGVSGQSVMPLVVMVTKHVIEHVPF